MDARLFYRDDCSELWVGDSLNPEHVAAIMHGRKADLTCLDAPYSEKTHKGHADGKVTAERAHSFAKAHADAPTAESRYAAKNPAMRNDLDYAAWSPADVAAFCALWMPPTVGWSVSITDDVLAPYWAHEFEACDRYRFAPLPLVENGSRCRMTGDGPSCWTCWVVVARPKTREFASWGTLPGAYVQPAERDINSNGGSDRVVGGKPRRAMVRIVSDYSRRGDLVVDQTAGACTTSMAAKMTGRRSIGIDTSEQRLEIGARRLRDSREQRGLFDEVAS